MCEEEAAHEFLDCVTWEPGVDQFLDMQYRPVLFIDGYYCISVSVFAKSRMARNLFKAQSKGGNLLMDRKNQNYDKLVTNFAHVLRESGFTVVPGVPVKFKREARNESDIDILAVRGEVALIIECKDTISAVGA